MIGHVAALFILNAFAQGLPFIREADVAMNPRALSPADAYCQSLCGSSSLSDCGQFGSHCKPFGPPEDGVGVCQGFYYLPDNTTCFFNTHPDPKVCPEDRPVFCGGKTTPGPTSSPTNTTTTTTTTSTTTTTTTTITTTTETTTTTTTTTTVSPKPSPCDNHPKGLYAGHTFAERRNITISAMFAETETDIQELTIGISVKPRTIKDIPYVMVGSQINITDYSPIPRAFRGPIQDATVSYRQRDDIIVFDLAALGHEVVLYKEAY